MPKAISTVQEDGSHSSGQELQREGGREGGEGRGVNSTVDHLCFVHVTNISHFGQSLNGKYTYNSYINSY